MFSNMGESMISVNTAHRTLGDKCRHLPFVRDFLARARDGC